MNLKEYIEILKSTNLEDLEKNRWIFDGPTKFLDGENIDGLRVGIFSYYRAGNTFIRKYMESITGIATGSNMGLENTMVLNL